MQRCLLWLDLAVKALLTLLLVAAALRPDLPAFAKPDMPFRVALYPLAILLVPALWWLVHRRRPVAYPFAVDILLTLPFLLDTISGATDVYDAIQDWDSGVHFLAGAVTAAAIVRLVRPLTLSLSLGRALAAALGIGGCAVAAILWELAQYATMLRHTPDKPGLYEDTVIDLACGLAGGLVGALMAVWLSWWAPATDAPVAQPTTVFHEDGPHD